MYNQNNDLVKFFYNFYNLLISSHCQMYYQIFIFLKSESEEKSLDLLMLNNKL